MASTHDLFAASETDTTVRWQCRICGRYSDFSKPGQGEPSATMFEYPENIDQMMDPCLGEYTGSARTITRDQFMDRFSSLELGALSESLDQQVKGMVFRMTNAGEVDLNDPRWADDLSRAASEGLIASNRPEIILA